MSLPLDSAVRYLGHAAESAAPSPRAKQRLDDVERLLRDDLRWVEDAVRTATEAGLAPAVDAAQHLVLRGGKRVRPMTLLLSCACFGAITKGARELAVVAELIHSATLLHDDVADEGTERRGAPTSRLLYGNAVSVLAGDTLLVTALERTLEHAPTELPSLIATIRKLVDGEVIQLRGRSELDVTAATYDRVLRGKTASLFAWAARMGARLGGASERDQQRLAQFGECMGMAFQLVDDVLDYSGERTGKTLLADLREGKLTLPLVLCVERRPDLLGALRQIHQGDHEPVARVSQAVLDSGACDEVRLRARQQTDLALAELRQLPASPARGLLELVATKLVDRLV